MDIMDHNVFTTALRTPRMATTTRSLDVSLPSLSSSSSYSSSSSSSSSASAAVSPPSSSLLSSVVNYFLLPNGSVLRKSVTTAQGQFDLPKHEVTYLDTVYALDHLAVSTLLELVRQKPNEIACSIHRRILPADNAVVLVEALLCGVVNNITRTTEIIARERVTSQESFPLEKLTLSNNFTVEKHVDVLYSLSPQGDFEMVSSSSYVMWGYWPFELVGKNCWDMLDPRDRVFVMELVVQLGRLRTVSHVVNVARLLQNGTYAPEQIAMHIEYKGNSDQIARISCMSRQSLNFVQPDFNPIVISEPSESSKWLPNIATLRSLLPPSAPLPAPLQTPPPPMPSPLPPLPAVSLPSPVHLNSVPTSLRPLIVDPVASDPVANALTGAKPINVAAKNPAAVRDSEAETKGSNSSNSSSGGTSASSSSEGERPAPAAPSQPEESSASSSSGPIDDMGQELSDGRFKRKLKDSPAKTPCKRCGVLKSLEWRRGSEGLKNLCNACGLKFARFLKHKYGAASLTIPPYDKVENGSELAQKTLLQFQEDAKEFERLPWRKRERFHGVRMRFETGPKVPRLPSLNTNSAGGNVNVAAPSLAAEKSSSDPLTPSSTLLAPLSSSSSSSSPPPPSATTTTTTAPTAAPAVSSGSTLDLILNLDPATHQLLNVGPSPTPMPAVASEAANSSTNSN